MRCFLLSLVVSSATIASSDALLGTCSAAQGRSQAVRGGWVKACTGERQSSANNRRVWMMSGGGGGEVAVEGEKSTMSQSIANLAKNIMGAGMFSLPAGVAAFSDAKSAIVPASALIAILGLLSGYTFSLLGRSCGETGAESYEQAWSKSVSDKTAWVPATACVCTCFAGCLAYTLIIGDSVTALLQGFGLPQPWSSRTNVIAGASAFVLLPLSLLKSLKGLGFTSLLGSSGLLYTAAVMAVRYFDGSYSPGGRFYDTLDASFAPVFGTKAANPVLFLVLISMLGTAYEAHFNAPLFHKELENNTNKRYNIMVGSSFAISIATMIAVTAFGFLTFGGNSSGLILNNYAASDGFAAAARVVVALSIMFSYPLCFVGLRDGILELRGITKPSDTMRTSWTVGLVGFVSLLSVFLTDLGFVNSFGGTLIANCIIYIFPATMFLTPVRRAVKKGALNLAEKGLLKMEFLGAKAIVALGVVMAILGAIISVLESFFPNVLG
ncbi:unnamed protein product [Chrysoparadoxa australica]